MGVGLGGDHGLVGGVEDLLPDGMLGDSGGGSLPTSALAPRAFSPGKGMLDGKGDVLYLAGGPGGEVDKRVRN